MRNFNLLLCAGLSFAFIGCGSGAPQQGAVDPPKEIFDAQLLTNLPPGIPVEINSQITNTVQVEVVVYPDDLTIPGGEVAVDYARTGWDTGPDEDTAKEKASLEAENNIKVTLQAGQTVKIHIEPGTAVPYSKDTVVLHVRLPSRTPLLVALQAGNIRITGDLTDVEAFTDNGNIEVRGATGSLRLTTLRGNIYVDDLHYRPEQQGFLKLTATGGNIELYAVNVGTDVNTTKGNIRFIGSLAEGVKNSFATTEGGNIMLALPDNVPYTFKAVGGKQVLNDFTAGTLVCGAMDGGVSDFHEQKTPSTIGHTLVGNLITTTDSVSGTMLQNKYFLFHTNRTVVAKFLPDTSTSPQHAGTLWTPECDGPDHEKFIAPTYFSAQTGQRGIIEVRLIRKH